MQNKGAIIVFAIALALVSLYYLSFSWVTNKVKNDAEEYAQGDLLKEIHYLDSMANQEVYNFFWIRKYTLRECQERELNLGLDLKGGMNVVLEVSVIDVVRSLSGHNNDTTFVAALQLAQEKQQDSQQDFITLFKESFEEIAPNSSLAAIFATYEMRDRIKMEMTNDEVIEVIREETQDAIDNSFQILRQRIDRFGVAQPNIQRQEGRTGRILVELPGVKDPERVRKLLQGTAKLEFWETYTNQEIYPYINQANTKIKELLEAESSIEQDEADTSAVADTTQIIEEGVEEFFTDSDIENPDSLFEDDAIGLGDESMEDTIGEETPLVDQLDETQDSAQLAQESIEEFNKNNPLFAVLRPNVSQDGQLINTAGVGYAHFTDTAKVMEYLHRPQVREIFPRDLKFFWQIKPIDEGESIYQLVAIKTERDGSAALSGDVITDAYEDFGQNQASAEVTMVMNGEGAKEWARLTKENIGRQVAIVLDNFVYSFPTVNSEIPSGRSQITGDFTIAEAQDLANILKSGKLPAPARIVEFEIVGPSLGHEAIRSGMFSFLIAFVVVLLYMIFYYKTAGIVANVALIINVFFIFGVLASLGAVLTLPGIAGIVLTIGMSVDANVLIYERVREELKLGKGLRLAVSDGYKNAYSAIIDANLTTLITGIILYLFGHGPIKGFATTLIIGILTSLFAAIFITRLIFTYFLDKEKDISFSTKLTKDAFKNLNVDFLGNRKKFYIISGIVIVLGIGSLIGRGLNQGVDFLGGRTYVVRFDHEVSSTEIASMLADPLDEAPEVKIFGETNQVKITTKYLIDQEGIEVDSIIENQLYLGLREELPAEASFDDFIMQDEDKTVGIMSSRKVGPTIADDIKTAALYSILAALTFIFLYIFARFRNWQFGLGALAALVHDSLVVIGLFSLLHGIMPFSLEIDQAFIAAILTVVGYSINDTVVVFDRIREYLGSHRKYERKTLYNMALNTTLSRTFSTSLSTFFVLLTIFFFGGEVIRGFIFALLVGVLVGTYSSLFIATPVVFDSVKEKDEAEIAATATDEAASLKERRKAKRKKTAKA